VTSKNDDGGGRRRSTLKSGVRRASRAFQMTVDSPHIGEVFYGPTFSASQLTSMRQGDAVRSL
jgi:hypothetical protein